MGTLPGVYDPDAIDRLVEAGREAKLAEKRAQHWREVQRGDTFRKIRLVRSVLEEAQRGDDLVDQLHREHDVMTWGVHRPLMERLAKTSLYVTHDLNINPERWDRFIDEASQLPATIEDRRGADPFRDEPDWTIPR